MEKIKRFLDESNIRYYVKAFGILVLTNKYHYLIMDSGNCLSTIAWQKLDSGITKTNFTEDIDGESIINIIKQNQTI